MAILPLIVLTTLLHVAAAAAVIGLVITSLMLTLVYSRVRVKPTDQRTIAAFSKRYIVMFALVSVIFMAAQEVATRVAAPTQEVACSYAKPTRVVQLQPGGSFQVACPNPLYDEAPYDRTLMRYEAPGWFPLGDRGKYRVLRAGVIQFSGWCNPGTGIWIGAPDQKCLVQVQVAP